MIDGFFFPGFGAHLARGNPVLIEPGLQVISAAALALQILAKFGVLALAVAIVLWSIGLFDGDRMHAALAIAGCVSAVALVVVIAAVATQLNPHNAAPVFALQTLWYAFAGVLMIQRRL